MTNEHVVHGCQKVQVSIGGRLESAQVIMRDRNNDLALLRVRSSPLAIAKFRAGAGARPGEKIIALGYPYRGILAEGLIVTEGIVSATAGIGNDFRYLQITAPVQAGNSGGPLLDEHGNLVGIVVAKLDALAVAEATGDIPQNVNFAIKRSLVEEFLTANGVRFSPSRSELSLPTSKIVEQGRDFTALVMCHE